MLADLHQMDGYEDNSDEAVRTLGTLSDALIGQFIDSPEGKAHSVDFPGPGFWIDMLLDYGFRYEGVTLPTMSAHDVEELLTNVLPRKITLHSRESAECAIPELKAFWFYLMQAYALPQADSVIKSLDKLAPRFVNMMFDSSRFGMAKSFMMAGQEAGFDMTNQDEMDKFMHLYNAQIIQDLDREPGPNSGPLPVLSPSLGSSSPFSLPERPSNQPADKVKKNKRKMAKASQKKNRKKKRK